MPGKRIRVEKSVPGAPGVSGRLHANVGSYGIHQHVGDGAFERFVIIPNFPIIDVVASEEFANTILPSIIGGVQLFELVNKQAGPFTGRADHEVNMIGHQNKSDDKYAGQKSRNGNIVHRNPEIFFIPEPETVLQMICRN